MVVVLCTVYLGCTIQQKQQKDKQKNEIVILKTFQPRAPSLFSGNYRDMMDSLFFLSVCLSFFLFFKQQKSLSQKQTDTIYIISEFTAAQTSSPVGVSNPTCEENDRLLFVSNIQKDRHKKVGPSRKHASRGPVWTPVWNPNHTL